jgi:hypothetical protein
LGVAGSPATGGGGGAYSAQPTATVSAYGGSGIVAIAYRSDTAIFTGGSITPGAFNGVSPGYTVHTFTSPGTFAFTA